MKKILMLALAVAMAATTLSAQDPKCEKKCEPKECQEKCKDKKCDKEACKKTACEKKKPVKA